MEMLLDVVLDTFLDAAKLLPFLFIAFILIEFVEHKMGKKGKEVLAKSKKTGPIIGGLLGAIPQCGFSALCTNLYVTRIISLGTLISVYLSTSDEMLLIMLGKLGDGTTLIEILKIIGIKVLIGIIFGYIIDLIIRKKDVKTKHEDYHMCDDDHCDCDHSIIKSSLIHTLKTVLFIIIVTFIINLLFEIIGEDNLQQLFMKNTIFAPFIAALIGLIPNCGASIALTEFYLSDVISLGTAIGGLLTGAGVGLIILFKQNKNIKENLLIVALIYFIGSIMGILLNLIGV
ncbi:MAG: arsenic efflux protein [Bacilli bacterium]|nr:arsenic efflux protein [Bacilli bacterium]